MKRQLKKPMLANSVKSSLGLGIVSLARGGSSRTECATGGDVFTTQACKGNKCCNGAGGC